MTPPLLPNISSIQSSHVVRSHPALPYYASSHNAVGGVVLWEYEEAGSIAHFLPAMASAPPTVSTLCFSSHGDVVGAADTAGYVSLWKLHAHVEAREQPFMRIACDPNGISDVVFLNDGTIFAAAGAENGGQQGGSYDDRSVRSVGLWDSMLAPHQSMVCDIEASGVGHVKRLHFSSRYQCLVMGDSKGGLHTFDIRQRRIMATLDGAHSGGVTAMATCREHESLLVTGGAAGDLHVWSLEKLLAASAPPLVTVKGLHGAGGAGAAQAGVRDIVATAATMYTAGGDGTVKQVAWPQQ